MQALLALDAEGPLELVPTFLGAHAIAPEFKDDPQGYTDLLCSDLLPRTCQWWLEHAGRPSAAVCGCLLRDRRLRPGPVPPDS